MSESKFKTLRHIETVRNYLNYIIRLITYRQEQHDQTKLESPEVEYFEEFTSKLKGLEYGSDEYRQCLRQMKPAIVHHNKHNRHHPEHFENGIKGMHLIDLIELMCDWKAASMRYGTGDIMKSIEINKDRFGYSDDLEQILINTAHLLNSNDDIYHKAEES